LTYRFARALVSLLLVAALHGAAPCQTEPPVTTEIRDLDVFPADPLAATRAGASGFTALHNAPLTDWAQRIDQTWGPSPWTIPEMLDLFDTFWNTIDASFACFQGLDVDWAALRTSAVPRSKPG
jgi:hypothetical protein